MFMKLERNKIISLFLTLGIVIFFIIYFSNNIESFSPLLEVRVIYLLLITCLFLILFFLNGFFTKKILALFGINLGFKEYTGLSVLNTAGNYFSFFTAGSVIKAVYLKKKHNFTYSKFIGTTSGNYLLVFLVNSIFTLIAIFIIEINGNKVNPFVTLFFLFLFLLLLFLTFVPIRIRQSKIYFLSRLKEVMDSWSKIKKNKSLIIQLLILASLNVFLYSLILFLQFQSVNVDLSFYKCIFLSTVSGLAIFVNITPGNLGVREGLMFLIGSSIVTFDQVLMVSLLDRGLLALILIVLTPIFTNLLMKGEHVQKNSI